MRFYKLIVLIVFFSSCNNVDQKSHSLNETIRKENPKPQSNFNTENSSPKAKRIGDFMSDTTDFTWAAKQSDTASYWIRITFQKEFAVYQFHGQCLYWFFTNHYHTGTDKLELLWSYKTDCILDMNFLGKSNGVKHYPRAGDSFCEYKLVNDSVIAVKYNFGEWTTRINELAKDSIFPSYLYLERKGGI